MLKLRREISVFVLPVLMATAVVAFAADDTAPVPMTQVEQDGYLQWLHSLEQEVALRTEKGIDESFKLFPFATDKVTLGDTAPYRHLTIAKALAVLEDQFQDPRQAADLSSLVALANARNYVNLTEYDSALIWFDVAALKDTIGDFRTELGLETMATAIAAGDSLRMAGEVGRLVAGGFRSVPEDEIILALRWCLVDGDKTQLASLADSLVATGRETAPAVRFWAARAFNRLDRPNPMYAQLTLLVQNGGLSLGLTENQRGWVLTTLADASYRLGLAPQARRLYSTLTESPLENLNLWATYQLAGMDLAQGDFLAAATGYGTVCRAKLKTSWHAQACAMAKVASEIESIRREGEPYGTSRFYNP